MGMGSKMEGPSTPAIRRDPYEVLSVSKDSTDQEIKTAYRKLALKYVLLFRFPFEFFFSFSFIIIIVGIFHVGTCICGSVCFGSCCFLFSPSVLGFLLFCCVVFYFLMQREWFPSC